MTNETHTTGFRDKNTQEASAPPEVSVDLGEGRGAVTISALE